MSEQHVSTTAEAKKPKKRKKVKKAAAAPVAEDVAQPSAEPAPKPRRGADDIDCIFAGQSRKRAAQAQPALKGQADASVAEELAQQHATARAATQPQRQRPADQGSKDDIFAEGPAKARRVDEEGLPVYSTKELNVGKGGNTAACPFDCDCCF